MKTIAFYSYKGGVGRTLALAHVAYWLSKQQKTVFLLDMDLEAPGLHYKLEQYNEPPMPTKGLVDFVGHFRRNGSASESLDDYVIKLIPKESEMADMWLMPAGNPFDSNYWTQLAEIEWKDFLYSDQKYGALLFLELKAHIEKVYAPDFLLIDSRTGLTDLTSIGLDLLADDAVVLGVNNPENIDGSRIVLEKLRRREKLPFKDEPTRLHFVLTRIPAPTGRRKERVREKDIKTKVLERLNAGSGIASGPLVTQVNVIHIDEEQALEERIRFRDRDWDKYPILKDYIDLVYSITGVGYSGDDSFWATWLDLYTAESPTESAKLARKLLRYVSKVPEQELERAKAALTVLNDPKAAIKILRNLMLLRPDWADSHNLMGIAHQDLKDWKAALAEYDKAISLEPASAHAYYNRGMVFGEMGNHEAAIADYTTALELVPEDAATLNNRAVDYFEMGDLKRAMEDVTLALELEPHDPDTLTTFADIQSELGNTELFYATIEKAMALDVQVVEKLALATVTRHQGEPRFQALKAKAAAR